MKNRKVQKLLKLPSKPNLKFEKALKNEGFHYIAGVDEVGRGAWAGPVVAAAVVLPERCSLPGVNDSKLLSSKLRKTLSEKIKEQARAFGVGVASAAEVDSLGLSQANALAVTRALRSLPESPDHVLLDGYGPEIPNIPSTSFIKGDRISLSIAAASIVAKVFRDELMEAWEAEHPGFGFNLHKGYGTQLHRRALQSKGPSDIHRKSYGPMANLHVHDDGS